MSAAMARRWRARLLRRNLLQQARDREAGTDAASLYPARPFWPKALEAQAKDAGYASYQDMLNRHPVDDAGEILPPCPPPKSGVE